MKQLQWDKLPHQQVSKTLWSVEKPDQEMEMLQKLQMDGVWMEMEEDFKAKQLVINLMGKISEYTAVTPSYVLVTQPDRSVRNSKAFWIPRRRSVLVGLHHKYYDDILSVPFRNLDTTRPKAAAGRDCSQDTTV